MLTSLQTDTRQDLRDVLDGLGTALNSEPTAADDRDADPSARGETAAESCNDAYDDAGRRALAAQVNEALLGTEPARPRAADRGPRPHAGALIRNEEQLKDLITNFNATMAAFAAEQATCASRSASSRRRSRTPTRAFASLNAAFPPTRAFAREILPGVRETPATIEAAFPWIEQTRAVSRGRARRAGRGPVAGHARPRAADRRAIDLLPQTNLVSAARATSCCRPATS